MASELGLRSALVRHGRTAREGIEVTGLLLGTPKLGRTGEVIQATFRAWLELEREQAEAVTCLVRAVNDADLDARSTSAGPARRYRVPDLWSDLIQRTAALRAVGQPRRDGLAAGRHSRSIRCRRWIRRERPGIGLVCPAGRGWGHRARGCAAPRDHNDRNGLVRVPVGAGDGRCR